MENKLSHLDKKGNASMVDVGEKNNTKRIAIASAKVRMDNKTLKLITENGIPKGDVLSVARIAGIQAAKKTFELIPMCHLLPIDKISVDFNINSEESLIEVKSTAVYTGKTGVEMEALTAVTIASLTIYDMCKAVDKGIVVDNVQLEYKEGGKSGIFKREVS